MYMRFRGMSVCMMYVCMTVNLFFFLSFSVQFMALMGKYTKFLFDLSADPNERNNLYFSDKYSDVKVYMTRMYGCMACKCMYVCRLYVCIQCMWFF